METTFYVIGGALTVLALIISFIGMKSEKFPTDTQLRIGVGLFAAVVVVTAVFAVRASQEEALHREHEENIEAAAEEDEATLEDQNIGTEDEDTGEISGGDESDAPGDRDEVDEGDVQGASGEGDPELGVAVFTDQGCGGCHSLEATSSTGQIGPNLDVELVDKDEEFIETSIIDPGAEVVEGFGDGIMPTDYGEVIPPDDLANLVAFLYDATHEGAK